MIVKNPKFEISAVRENQYPKNGLPEVVLVGKSNVGKSSFINTMINRKKLARTSSEPGKTRQLNFYNIDDLFYFVDLPGYGYSQMSKKQETEVANYINEYLQKSNNINLILFLVDIRHKPTNLDKLMFDWLIANKKKFIIIANKADKVAKTKTEEYTNIISESLNLRKYGLESSIPIIAYSSMTKLNKEKILNIVEKNI